MAAAQGMQQEQAQVPSLQQQHHPRQLDLTWPQ